ncbi:hypothetical protein BCR32DRAFT_277553 [Anaeromyces robustus]|uniref:Uncharacterized protein n=1 Tax=Anaeromyces robustus TaxID=1754192 RepID=A0A1Y1XE04_9FUNG|nr:hypothetical protein BCR32DRAFT_277553 [Anaeromyces robustus]|eukprot:ORX83990.1 hypothetical protein BCR32DRAFT_277553 [Anaeromyces robustus]
MENRVYNIIGTQKPIIKISKVWITLPTFSAGASKYVRFNGLSMKKTEIITTKKNMKDMKNSIHISKNFDNKLNGINIFSVSNNILNYNKTSIEHKKEGIKSLALATKDISKEINSTLKSIIKVNNSISRKNKKCFIRNYSSKTISNTGNEFYI